MQAGSLRHPVVIQTPTITRGASYSDPQPSWATFANVFASVEPLRGREYVANREEQVALDVRVRIRYLAGVNEKMRVLHGSHTYEIASVIDVGGRGRELELMCREQK